MPPSAVARRCRTTESVARHEPAERAACRPAARRRAAAGLALLGLAVSGAPALAQEPTGGTSPALGAPPRATETPAPSERASRLAPPPTANLYGSPAPRIGRVACRSACGSAGAASPGSLVRLKGRNLAPLDEVVFLGGAGDADDTSVAPRRVRGRTALARVPRTAATGPLAAVRPDGTRSPASRRLKIEPRPVDVPAGMVDAEVQGRRVFFGAQRPAELSYVVGGSEPASVEVELVRAGDPTVLERWTPGEVEPDVPQTVRWDGTVAGMVQPDGLYQFRVTASGASGARATSSATGAPGGPGAPGASASRAGGVSPAAPGAFRFLRHRFPLIGAHDYAEAAARFGGGRGHQGQDVFAECGTPVVAARGGVVKFKQFQSAAGNYVVIDGARTGVDFGYMHLREAALVDEGERVKTGQPIGFVGATGRASGCHLHFEEWTAPGWYSGGSPVDPLPDLRAWDAQS
jgi:Peptidase family M23